jgi:hypothetical protein
MRRLFRPSLLVLLLVVLALGAAALMFWPRAQVTRAAPLRDNEYEIVWLYAATNSAAWERFVAAASRVKRRLTSSEPELGVAVDDSNSFPRQTTAHAELVMTVRGGTARLVFRWYKLTSDQPVDKWIKVLMDGSRRPPLAILGGSSSEQAKEIALSLKDQVEHGKTDTPLLLLTSATAEHVIVGDNPEGEPLTALHKERTFRFCFTNQQMADAATDFLWAHDELRPDPGPFYVAEWNDDAYSLDLTERFVTALERQQHNRGGLLLNPIAERIDYSVGLPDQPNRWEAPAARRLMEAKLTRFPGQQRPLLVLAAPDWQPARRFLRGLARTAPREARRFVLVTGDALSFDTLYRDRNPLWPVQDLPFDLVSFCHRSPVDADAQFPRDDTHVPGLGPSATSTEDLLLYGDIVEALVRAVNQGSAMPADGGQLAQRLRGARWSEEHISFDRGTELFDSNGNRRSGTGEHIVLLRPTVKDERVLPQATIEVYAQQAAEQGGSWRLLRRLPVEYDDVPAEN